MTLVTLAIMMIQMHALNVMLPVMVVLMEKALEIVMNVQCIIIPTLMNVFHHVQITIMGKIQLDCVPFVWIFVYTAQMILPAMNVKQVIS